MSRLVIVVMVVVMYIVVLHCHDGSLRMSGLFIVFMVVVVYIVVLHCHDGSLVVCSLYFHHLMSRLFIIVMVVVSVAWVPIIKETSGGQVFIYINEVSNYLAPPFAAIFLLAVLVPRVNEKVRIVGHCVSFCFRGNQASVAPEDVCAVKDVCTS